MLEERHKLAEQERADDRDRWSDSAIDREPVLGRRGKRRLLWVAAALLVIVLLVTLPPLVNINRYQHRVASAIAASIGRPVRFDSIELHILPVPGFTIHNFVVMEDGRFGAEPAMRANEVQARVRFASLWRHRVEISRIRLLSPTVNLVRNDAGYWNVQGVVTQAAQVQSAPTAQRSAGDAPRFPYIEATDARINLKLGDTKLPYALTDAEFSLWLPDPKQWRLRLAGRPLRTDTDASDVGELRVEASLGRTGGNTAQEPLHLDATWKPTPLGEASKLAMGSDAGWRGTGSAEAVIQGTPADMHVTTDVHVRDLRRAEFVPAQTLDLDAHCEADVIGVARQFHGVRCALPTGNHGSLLDSLPFFKTSTAMASAPDVLTLQADVPDPTDLHTATATLDLQRASPDWFSRWMRLFSSRMPATTIGGRVALHLAHPSPEVQGWTGSIVCQCKLPAAPAAPAFAQAHPETQNTAMADSFWLIQALPASSTAVAGDVPGDGTPLLQVSAMRRQTTDERAAEIPALAADVSSVATGAVAMTGTIGSGGAVLRYQDTATARELAAVLPALADDLPTADTGPIRSDRTWGKTQVWTSAVGTSAPQRIRSNRHRRHAPKSERRP